MDWKLYSDTLYIQYTIYSVHIKIKDTFIAVLKLVQFSGSTPIIRTSGFIVLIARATP